ADLGRRRPQAAAAALHHREQEGALATGVHRRVLAVGAEPEARRRHVHVHAPREGRAHRLHAQPAGPSHAALKETAMKNPRTLLLLGALLLLSFDALAVIGM